MNHRLLFLCVVIFVAGCRQAPDYSVDVINGFTPVKNRGKNGDQAVYAILAAIETEHIMRGDSVNLSAAFLEKQMAEAQRVEGELEGERVLRCIQEFGLVPYESMPPGYAPPRYAFMYGCRYTPQEFARSVCTPQEYRVMKRSEMPVEDILQRTEKAVRNHRGVGWESDLHCRAIVGLAHDANGRQWFIMKESLGEDYQENGLVNISYEDFLDKTIAVYYSAF